MESQIIREFDPGIPLLDPAWQATYHPAEWVKWGTVARSSNISGKGYYMYCDDYKHVSLWKKPWRVPRSGCTHAVEVNYTTKATMSSAVALYRTYRKRLLARLWGQEGVKLFVDLYVCSEFHHFDLCGVPRGWRAYATRSGCLGGLAAIREDWDRAVAHAGTLDILFAVFGGRRKVRALCLERGWHHVPEQVRSVRGLD
jgi:hypothetical protein